MLCGQCGTPNARASAHCVRCGASLVRKKPSDAAKTPPRSPSAASSPQPRAAPRRAQSSASLQQPRTAPRSGSSSSLETAPPPIPRSLSRGATLKTAPAPRSPRPNTDPWDEAPTQFITPASPKSDPAWAAALTPTPETQTTAELGPVWQLAPRRRLLASVIDAALLFCLFWLLSAVGLFGQSMENTNWLEPDDVAVLMRTGELYPVLIGLLVVVFVISSVLHGVLHRSVGKALLGLEVVNTQSGESPSLGQAIGRGLATLVSILSLGAGYFWLIVDRSGRTLHDILGGTTVVVRK